MYGVNLCGRCVKEEHFHPNEDRHRFHMMNDAQNEVLFEDYSSGSDDVVCPVLPV